VGAGEATLLATIVREKPIYVYFDVSERDFLVHPELLDGGAQAGARRCRSSSAWSTRPASAYRHARLHQQPRRGLDRDHRAARRVRQLRRPHRPRLFVRVRVPYGRGPSLLVPDDAVLSDQRGRYVLVVGEHDLVEQRPVEVGRSTIGCA